MAYLALYREWRPRTFFDVVGQDHVVRTLLNSIINNKVSHAYLFCGPRGTGKTSIAKILARAVNCGELQEGNPCGRCELCREIEAGTCMDVIEIDAASHRGIDEVREIREQVRFAPSSGKKRVFIIDEVHMLTNEAFNALLKTLEEPPSHAVFILATTEPHRLPLTILSRCQRFDFHRVKDEDMLKRLKQVVEGSGINIDSPALDLIVRASEGSVRDALSILDQAAAYGGNTVGTDEIHSLLGTVKKDILDNVALALMRGDAGKVLELVGQVVEQGKDLRVFLKEINSHLHDLLIEMIEKNAREADRLAGIIRLLSLAEQEMRWSTQPRVVLEVALIRAARALSDVPDESQISQLSARVKQLEVMLSRLSAKLTQKTGETAGMYLTGETAGMYVKENGLETVSQKTIDKTRDIQDINNTIPVESPISKDKKDKEDKEATLAGSDLEVAPEPEKPVNDVTGTGQENPQLLRKVDSRWNDILDMARRVYPNIASQLTQGKGWPLALEGGTLTIGFPRKEPYTKLAIGILNTETNLKELSGLIKSVCQVELNIRLAVSDKKPPSRGRKPKKALQPDDIEMIFGEGTDVPASSFDGFDD